MTMFYLCFLNVVLHGDVFNCNTILCVVHSYCARYFMCYSVLMFVLINVDLKNNCANIIKIIYCDVCYIILKINLNNL